MTNKNIVVKVSPSKLIPNKTKLDIYQAPSNYEEMKENIKEHGILEPLIVNKNTSVIISGNLRHQIALELGLTEVPVLFQEVEEEDMNLKSISTNQQRVKSTLEIFREIEFFEQHYKIKKGQRTDLNPELKEIKEKRDSFLKSHSRTKREKIKAVAKLAEGLYLKESEEFKGIFKSIDAGKTTLNGMWQQLIDMTNRKHNEQVIPEKYEIIRKNTKIYNHSSENMHEIKNESINAIITSPPYFRMKDYGNGENELGQESQVDLYLTNMMKVFKECYRVLRNDGNLFVNLNDCVLGGEYKAVPYYFLLEMLKLGWKFNDEIIWLKNNPTYSKGKRSVRSHEPIFHFVKSPDFYYNDQWLDEIEDTESKLIYGAKKSSPKVRSGIDYRDGVLVTNVSSTKELREKAKKQGFHLTHSATFPLGVPTICGLLGTKKGDTVLDCFTGTSTTGLFALAYKRKFVGFEVNPQFVKASETNLMELQFYNRNYEAEKLFSSGQFYNIGIVNPGPSFLKNFNHSDILSVSKVSSEFSKPFKTFTKGYNDCYRIVQKVK